MESNTPHPMPAGPNDQEQNSTPEEHERPNNQPVSYHRSITDGSYVGVNLSPGFRFVPKEEELIMDFLNKKINNQPAKYIQISDVNVYKHTPEELAGNNQSSGEEEWYFFSPRDRKYLNGNLPNRAAGNGYWKATGADRKIYHNDVCIGSKRCLVFYEGKPPTCDKTNWIMHEYVANQPRRQPRIPNDMRLDDCVLCRIYKKPDHPPKGEEEENDDAAKCCKTKKPAARRRGKTEQNGTNQHQNFPLQPNIQGQSNLQVPMQPQNLQAVQYSLMAAGNHTLGGQLGYHLESAPESARQIRYDLPENGLDLEAFNERIQGDASDSRETIDEPNLPMPQNLPHIQGQCNIQVQPSNLPMMQQHLQAIQCSLMAGNHNLGGQLDYHLQSAAGEAGQIRYDHPENSLEPFNDMVGHQTYPSVFHSGLGHFTLPGQNFNDFDLDSLMDCFF